MYACYDPECSCPSCDGQYSEPTLADECQELLVDDYNEEDRRAYDAAMLAYEYRVALYWCDRLGIEIPF
jgi:hypothetical protein